VILHKYDYQKWLDPETQSSELKRLMQPLPDEEIRAKEAK